VTEAVEAAEAAMVEVMVAATVDGHEEERREKINTHICAYTCANINNRVIYKYAYYDPSVMLEANILHKSHCINMMFAKTPWVQ